MMLIKNIKARTINIPLDSPIYMGGYSVEAREYVFVEIELNNGITGFGFTFTRDGEVSKAIIKHLKPLLENENPLAIERIWESMYWNTRYIGRKGLLMRAISAVDIALWDIKGKLANMPIYQLIGGAREQIPALMACGYYIQGKTIDDLVSEVTHFAAEGYQHIKIMVGGASMDEDIERIKQCRKALGNAVHLAIDVNGVWTNWKDSLAFVRKLEQYNLSFIEEPFQPDQLPEMTQFTDRAKQKVAIGEVESSRWAFRTLLSKQAADILRPDATLVGGISEWIKIANTASTWNVNLIPHYFPYVHIHLVTGITNATCVEVVTKEKGISNFDKIVKETLKIENGIVHVPQSPGLGIEWDWEQVDHFTTEIQE